MSILSTLRHDRIALVGMGFLGVGVIWGISTLILNVMDDNKIDPPQPKTQYITQDTEDSLPPDTLDKLLYHPSYSIREVSLKILCDRAVNDADTMRILLYGITKKDYDHRTKCLRAIGLLVGQSGDSLAKLHTDMAYAALVKSLEIGLDDVERPKLDDPYWDEYHLRDVAERLCLVIIFSLVQKHGPQKLIDAKFVERWLAKQDWGDTEEERQKNFKEYNDNRNNNLIRDIIDYIKNTNLGKASLRKAKLIPKRRSTTRQRSGWSISAGDGPTLSDVRRQRREAFVFNDGSRPVGQGDIIQRDHDEVNEFDLV